MARPKQLPSGAWQVRWHDPTGKQRKQTFRRKMDATDFTRDIEYDVAHGSYTDPNAGKITLDDWWKQWIAARQHLKPKTLEGYRSLYRTKIKSRFGSYPLNRIEHLAIEEWVADLRNSGLSPSRIRQAHQLLSALLKAAVPDRLKRNPAWGVEVPRVVQREQGFLDTGQLSGLAAAVPDRYRALIWVLGYGGLRWAEAVGLRRRRCDLLHGRLIVAETMSEVSGKFHRVSPKNDRTRTVNLPAFVTDALAEHLANYTDPAPDALVFTVSKGGGPLRNSNFRSRVWLPALRATGLSGIRVHDLRHTAAALLVAEGAHPLVVKSHLGHSSITVTMDVYGHLFASEAEELANRLDARHRAAADSVAPLVRPIEAQPTSRT